MNTFPTDLVELIIDFKPDMNVLDNRERLHRSLHMVFHFTVYKIFMPCILSWPTYPVDYRQKIGGWTIGNKDGHCGLMVLLELEQQLAKYRIN